MPRKATHKNIELPPLPFVRQQIMMLNPARHGTQSETVNLLTALAMRF